MKSSDCTLFSGGAKGAEEEFGVQAEKNGVEEVYGFNRRSFFGRNDG